MSDCSSQITLSEPLLAAGYLRIAGVQCCLVGPDADDTGCTCGQAVACACAPADVDVKIATPHSHCIPIEQGHLAALTVVVVALCGLRHA